MAGTLSTALAKSSPLITSLPPKLLSNLSKPVVHLRPHNHDYGLSQLYSIRLSEPVRDFGSFRRPSPAPDRGRYCICFYSGEESDQKVGRLDWPILKRWDVPWKWQTVSLTSLACGLSITTAVVLAVLYGITNSFGPLPDDVFRYDLKEPFNLQKGWLLWAGIGLVGALIAIALTGAAISFFSGDSPEREVSSTGSSSDFYKHDHRGRKEIHGVVK